MTSQHPFLHPKLENFSIFHSFEPLVKSEAASQAFLEEIGCIPSKTSIPPKCCDLPMRVEPTKKAKLKWVWRCASCTSKKARKKKTAGASVCRKTINPSQNTFFDGTTCRIGLNDILAIILCFVMNFKITDVIKHLANWRKSRDDYSLSNTTISDYYSYCREIAEVVASNSQIKLGGADKTIQIDETFLTKRKYHRGRITNQMSITVLGIYCKEDKTGLFFQVDGKGKADLWPLIKKYVDPSTTTICTDSAKQYCGVEKLFSEECVHLTTNHSKGEYVDPNNPRNTINDLENQNKLLKKSIVCRRSPKLLHQYMAMFFYRKNILEKSYPDDLGSQIMAFLEDMKRVYPGFVDGELKAGLFLKEFDHPSVDSEEIGHLLPPKRPRTMTIDELIDEASDSDDGEEV